MQSGREETDERADLLKKLAELTAREKELDKKLSMFSDFDPEALEKLKENTVKAKECANRWTDNVFTCQSWACNKFSMDRKDFGKHFEIPEELDYLE